MKIIAVLLNPTIDKIFEISNFQIGGTFKVKSSIIYPVGKAISFSLGVRELTKQKELLKVIALIGQEEIFLYSNFLTAKDIDFEFIKVKGKTRSNVTINDFENHTTTHIREEGFKVERQELEKLVKILDQTIQKGDICVFSGSIPPNVDSTIYSKLISLAKQKGAQSALDSNGEALLEGVKARPNILKPNLVELSQILKKPEINELNMTNIDKISANLLKEGRTLLNEDTKVVLITLGKDGAICITKDGALYGNVTVEAKDTVGSGDSFLAGFVLSYSLKKDILTCFKHAIACGAANTLTPGPGIFSIEDVKKIKEKVETKTLS